MLFFLNASVCSSCFLRLPAPNVCCAFIVGSWRIANRFFKVRSGLCFVFGLCCVCFCLRLCRRSNPCLDFGPFCVFFDTFSDLPRDLWMQCEASWFVDIVRDLLVWSSARPTGSLMQCKACWLLFVDGLCHAYLCSCSCRHFLGVGASKAFSWVFFGL